MRVFLRCFILLSICIMGTNLWSFNELYQYKLDLGKTYKTKENLQTLTIDPTLNLEFDDEDSYIRMEVGLNLFKDNFYILDNNLHKIAVFNKKGTFVKILGKQGKGPGDLMFPNCFYINDGEMFIYNDSRIDVFSDTFAFKRRIRTFFGVYSFLPRKGNFYCSTKGKSQEKLPILLELNGNGNIVNVVCDNELGDFIYERSNQGFVLDLNEEVGCLLHHWNKLYVYNPQTRQLKKNRIKYELLNKLEGWNDREINRKKGRTTFYSSMFVSAKCYEDFIYVFLRVPWLEILKIDREGNILACFRNDKNFRFMRWYDFVIEKQNGKPVFYVLGYSIAKEETSISSEYNLYRMKTGEL